MSEVRSSRVARVRPTATITCANLATIDVASTLAALLPAGCGALQAEFARIATTAPRIRPASEAAITALAQSAITAPPERAAPVVAQLERTIRQSHQAVVADTVQVTLQETLTAMSFTDIVARPDGYVLARQGQGGPEIRADVIPTDDGGVTVHFDADGFDGESCRAALAELESGMNARGIDLSTTQSQRKNRRRFVPSRIVTRHG